MVIVSIIDIAFLARGRQWRVNTIFVVSVSVSLVVFVPRVKWLARRKAIFRHFLLLYASRNVFFYFVFSLGFASDEYE